MLLLEIVQETVDLIRYNMCIMFALSVIFMRHFLPVFFTAVSRNRCWSRFVCISLLPPLPLLVADLFLGLMFLTWFPFSLERFLSFYFLLLVFLLRCRQLFFGTTNYFIIFDQKFSRMNPSHCSPLS